ncbi:dihydropteroate synthase [Methanomicrobium antiquum]|uniref:dihydropteroate synthase n=1 Tax=Methanomicrobium antiquum TaxID=487686 RepID=A0AAF0FPG1_9EURY|nr:dihydropteroate synthase [Methanomicrobium antiquum]WFN36077.1 dihydropteroate synthase [Methanomicrobium antiquum]
MQNCRIKNLEVGGGAPVRLMAVINLSPESFFNKSYTPPEKVFNKACELVENGADIIDIGARSTAPNSAPISVTEEIKRLKSTLNEFLGSGILISVDTMYPEVLEECLRYEIHCINDINGLANDAYAKVAGDSGLPAVLMATLKKPGDPVGFDSVYSALETVMKRAENAGIKDFILDPAVGKWSDSRTSENDWELCRRFSEFKRLKKPLLAAVSRKTFIGELLVKEPQDRLSGTLALTYSLLTSGASIVRAHDVSDTKDLIRVFEKLNR